MWHRVNKDSQVLEELSAERKMAGMKEGRMKRELSVFLTVLAIAGLAAGLMGVFAEARQVPVQDQQPAGSALRPAVMGPSGGVSTGHPLTTAAAIDRLIHHSGIIELNIPSYRLEEAKKKQPNSTRS